MSTLHICLLLMYVGHAALPVKLCTLHMGRQRCLTEPCAPCRTRSLHEELLALRVQKDTKQEVGERLAEEQDSLFRNVRHLNPEQSFAPHFILTTAQLLLPTAGLFGFH